MHGNGKNLRQAPVLAGHITLEKAILTLLKQKPFLLLLWMKTCILIYIWWCAIRSSYFTSLGGSFQSVVVAIFKLSSLNQRLFSVNANYHCYHRGPPGHIKCLNTCTMYTASKLGSTKKAFLALPYYMCWDTTLNFMHLKWKYFGFSLHRALFTLSWWVERKKFAAQL